jgi:hypothetical protein
MVSAAGADPTVCAASEEGPRIVRLHAARQPAARQSATDHTFIRYIFAPSKTLGIFQVQLNAALFSTAHAMAVASIAE